MQEVRRRRRCSSSDSLNFTLISSATRGENVLSPPVMFVYVSRQFFFLLLCLTCRCDIVPPQGCGGGESATQPLLLLPSGQSFTSVCFPSSFAAAAAIISLWGQKEFFCNGQCSRKQARAADLYFDQSNTCIYTYIYYQSKVWTNPISVVTILDFRL